MEASAAASRGRVVLESKERLKARGVASPDDGDALALTFAMPVGKKRKRPPVSDPPYHFSRPDLAWMGLPYSSHRRSRPSWLSQVP